MGNLEFEEIKKIIEKASNETVWSLQSYISKQLKERGLVRTRNITGERGEFLALKIYNETVGLPKLQIAPEGTKNIDALSRGGERYTIKTISGKSVNTGIFSGLSEIREEPVVKKFEYLIIVVLDQDMQADIILELTWEQFLKFKYWNAGMRGWGMTVNKRVISEAKMIYQTARSKEAKTWREHLYK